VHEEAHDRVEWARDELEQHEADHNRLRTAIGTTDSQRRVKAERREQGLVVDEQLEKSEREQEVTLSDEEKLGGVRYDELAGRYKLMQLTVVPVAKLVACVTLAYHKPTLDLTCQVPPRPPLACSSRSVCRK
jgi:hypothetical protein